MTDGLHSVKTYKFQNIFVRIPPQYNSQGDSILKSIILKLSNICVVI